MNFHHTLPVADHVARRETERAGDRLHELHGAWHAIVDEIVRPVSAAFRRGDRLAGAEYGRIVGRARAVMLALDPLVFLEDGREATRARPKGEQHEFRMVARNGKVFAAGGVLTGIDGIRLHLTRKRLQMDYQLGGFEISGHLLERSIQRNLVSWTGRFREVDETLYACAGLAVLWAHAFCRRKVPTRRVAYPLADGLMLGRFRLTAEETTRRVHCSRTGSTWRNAPAHPVLLPPGLSANVTMAETKFATVLDDDLLTIEQVDLRDGIREFVARERKLLDELRNAVFWRECQLAPSPGYAELRERIDAGADRLAAFLTRPHIDAGLRQGRPAPDVADEPDAVRGAASSG